MPYIYKILRKALEEGKVPENAGELNYQLTYHILKYLGRKVESYQTYNDVLGVLSAIPHELYRRKISKYEEKKINENGDVF